MPQIYTRRKRFQSTLPARGATGEQYATTSYVDDFNPRSPHGERHKPYFVYQNHVVISIHAPRTGSDVKPLINGGDKVISIHAPRTGSDVRAHGLQYRLIQISIHAPRTGSDVF